MRFGDLRPVTSAARTCPGEAGPNIREISEIRGRISLHPAAQLHRFRHAADGDDVGGEAGGGVV
jgi:hypothetical protein